MKTVAERNELRRKAYELHASGSTAYGIHKALGVSVQTASNWIKRFAERGEAGIGERKRGPETNPTAVLSPEDRGTIAQALEMAAELGVDAKDLNHTRTFRRMVRRVCDANLTAQTARRWMHRLGLHPGTDQPLLAPSTAPVPFV